MQVRARTHLLSELRSTSVLSLSLPLCCFRWFPCPSIFASVDFRVRRFPRPSISVSVDIRVRRFARPSISASVNFRFCQFPRPSVLASVDFRVRWFPSLLISMSVDFRVRWFPSPLISKSVDSFTTAKSRRVLILVNGSWTGYDLVMMTWPDKGHCVRFEGFSACLNRSLRLQIDPFPRSQ